MDELQKTIERLIEIVGSDDDAELFANLLFEETLYMLFTTVEGKKREKLEKQWNSNRDNHAAQTSIIMHNFTKEQIVTVRDQVVRKAVLDYLQANSDTLTDNKQKKLQEFAQELAA